MEQPVQVKEVKILETAEDIQERREQVKQAIFLEVSIAIFLAHFGRFRTMEYASSVFAII